MFWAASIEDDQMLDARLEQLGATVLSFVENGLTVDGLQDAGSAGHLRTRPTAALLYRFQIWSADGRLLMRSHEAPSTQSLMALDRFGYDTVRIGDEEYRTFALPSRDHRLVVQVAESNDERILELSVITAYYVALLLLPFGLLFAATWLLLRRSLASIHGIAVQLTNRNPLDFTRLRVEHPPQEMKPILKSLDDMFVRIGHAISIERRFTSVAAHELRTPLAGLRAHAQLAASARNGDEAREALRSVIEGVDRASHLLNQLLDVARMESVATDGRSQFQAIDIDAVYRDACIDLSTLVRQKQLMVTVRFEVPYIDGVRLGLLLIVRNLLANAILYCPPGGNLRVSTTRESGGHVMLSFDDSGPGIAAQDRERAFERFNRLGRNQDYGVGLGLSIVLMAVELHGARISLHDSELGGLNTRILFAPTREDARPARSTEPVGDGRLQAVFGSLSGGEGTKESRADCPSNRGVSASGAQPFLIAP